MPEVPAEDAYTGTTGKEFIEEASLNSSCLAHYKYNAITEELTLTLRKDGVHVYTGFSKARFEAFKADPTGRHYNLYIRLG